MTQRTALGGTLIGAAGKWQWSDGAPEPRVTDMLASWFFNFRCRAGYVEVLLSEAHKHRDVLGWVLSGVEAGAYATDLSGDHVGPRVLTDEGMTRMRVEPGEDPLLGNEPIVHKRAIPRVALVPISEWDEWSDANPIGARWDKADEAGILARARSLGWAG